jgi:hypothetical protein
MVGDFAAFHARWRLAGLAAPYLPLPLAPQVPAPGRAGPQPVGGITIFLPDTFPVPSREELRDTIEDALRGGPGPAHLAEWHALVRADNKAKNSIDRYGRLFTLQHLMPVLPARHGPALRRKAGPLIHALARYLCGEHLGADGTIRKDLTFIRKRLRARRCEPAEPEPGTHPAGPAASDI